MKQMVQNAEYCDLYNTPLLHSHLQGQKQQSTEQMASKNKQ